ncbi:hypothetical protein [Burkholderia contaminans]|uniref:hypothetical protein n=1 Tax=Burkholderia contaminans TaxID=488447 RepID=UPI001583DA2D|nr:hypothetical protein [Burkholderia contaminans]
MGATSPATPLTRPNPRAHKKDPRRCALQIPSTDAHIHAPGIDASSFGSSATAASDDGKQQKRAKNCPTLSQRPDPRASAPLLRHRKIRRPRLRARINAPPIRDALRHQVQRSIQRVARFLPSLPGAADYATPAARPQFLKHLITIEKTYRMHRHIDQRVDPPVGTDNTAKNRRASDPVGTVFSRPRSIMESNLS